MRTERLGENRGLFWGGNDGQLLAGSRLDAIAKEQDLGPAADDLLHIAVDLVVQRLTAGNGYDQRSFLNEGDGPVLQFPPA